MNTTGYDLSVDHERNDFLFSSFHLDFDVNNHHVFYPLVELNWILYPQNGGVRPRLRRRRSVQLRQLRHGWTRRADRRPRLPLESDRRDAGFGLAGQFNVLGNDTGRDLDLFRLTADMIVRY